MFKIILILILGSLGGLLAEKTIAPYLFANYSYREEGTTIINKTEKVVIKEDEALEEAIQKVKSSVVLVSAGNILQTGFIVSSDGLIAAAASPALAKKQPITISWRDKNFPAQIVKTDSKILFLKIEAANLPVVAFDDREPKLGNTVFLIGFSKIGNYFVNSGIIKSFDEINIVSNFKEDNASVLGSPLVNLRGEVLAIVYDIKFNEVISLRGIDKLF